MRKAIFYSFLLAAIVAAVPWSAAQDSSNKKPVTNKKCPIMPKSDVDPKIRVEYKGQYVYFCCEGCREMFEANPEAAIAKLSKEDQEAIKPNEFCPITKEPVDKSIWIEHEGRKVYFCCPGCIDKFKEQSEKKNN